MKVKFFVSYPFNLVLGWFVNKKFDLNDYKKLEIRKKELEKEWKKIENHVFTKIEKYSKIKWKYKIYYCYLVRDGFRGASISDPLTVKIEKNVRDSIKSLIHELIHLNLYLKVFSDLKPKNYDSTIFYHIPVYLIYNRILKELFPRDRKIYSLPIYKFKNKKYLKAIKISKRLNLLWRKSNKNIRDFMKYCLDKGLIK